jgi:hypothetical protein
MTWDDHDGATKRAVGPFQEEVATMIGEIDFTESSTRQKYTILVRAVVYIFNTNRKGLRRPRARSTKWNSSFDKTAPSTGEVDSKRAKINLP